MEIRPYREVKRKKTKTIKVGKVLVGGNAPITVQSMTNTPTTNVKSTINQINRLEEEHEKTWFFNHHLCESNFSW